MNKNSLFPIYIFIGGALAYNIIMPLFESLGNLAQSAINCRIGNMQMDIEERQCEHDAACELIKPVERQPTAVVGFEVPNEQEGDWSEY